MTMIESPSHAKKANHQAIIALGSNLGNRRANLSLALSLLRKSPGIDGLTPSNIYETAPVGVEDQPAFLNMVAGISTSLSPENLMELLLDTEARIGRVRTTRWGPRLIDLDLIFFEDQTRQTHDLTLPHPRWSQRSFVTVPLKDILFGREYARSLWDPVREQIEKSTPDSTATPAGE
jgi:2-amino-4-hydroxy-6-hydroxymethyldihydropteridine diphosphokinase